jgi:alkanesulfonate monooxygenase SsuD/methylene tetrahydromethanopterin reductase-like flavin-dependent oxidoreductase (luciferase family)
MNDDSQKHTSPIKFGFVAGAAGRPGASDAELYRNLLEDCEFHAALDYDTAWMIEHHFSDYFPTPDPLLVLAHIAAHFPRLNLGTCVLVTPWHQPIRLAEGMAALTNLTDAELHMGLGRGTARLEYEAFGVPMDEARDRFRETWEIIRTALQGEPFSYQGEYLEVPRGVRLRPQPDAGRIHCYGAIGSSSSAPLMAELGLPPICTSVGDIERQAATLRAWEERAQELGQPTAVSKPLMINCIVADSDEEAIAEAQTYMTRFMEAQVRHYESDSTDFSTIKGYEEWNATFERMKAMTDPAKIPPWTRWQLIGTPETVRERLQAFVDLGFNHFIVHTATPGVPREVGRVWSRRLAEEVVPELRGAGLPA